MKAPFHYLVKTKFLRLKSPKEIIFEEFEETFEFPDPSEARIAAFEKYRQYLLTFAGQNGANPPSERYEDLVKAFKAANESSRVQLGRHLVDFTNSVGGGIGVFFVINRPSSEFEIEDHSGDQFMICGVGGMGWADDPKSIMTALTHEYWYYDHYRIDKRDFRKNISFYEYDIAQAETNTILSTPFDWSGYNRPYAERYNENPFTDAEISFINALLQGGECNQVEYKPSLLFNHKTGKGGISIKGIIAKTICAFLTNKGEIQGLDFDYSLSNQKNVRDYFQMEYDQMLEHFLSNSVKSNVSGRFLNHEGKDLFLVVVMPSKHRPIFINGHESKEFYVRRDSSSRHVTDIEEIANYCIDTWSSSAAQ